MVFFVTKRNHQDIDVCLGCWNPRSVWQEQYSCTASKCRLRYVKYNGNTPEHWKRIGYSFFLRLNRLVLLLLLRKHHSMEKICVMSLKGKMNERTLERLITVVRWTRIFKNPKWNQVTNRLIITNIDLTLHLAINASLSPASV